MTSPIHRSRFGFGLACVLAFTSSSAAAAPPGHWAIGIERLFGLRHTWTTDGPAKESYTSIALGTQLLPGVGYATPRVAADYLLELGLSFGGALAYGNFDVDRDYDDYEDGSWLLAPRAGFFLRPLPNLALWPRAGLTLLRTTADLTGRLSALTLEAPVVLSLPGHIVTCTLTPYAELGYSAGSDGFFGLLPTDHDASELGLALGATVFF